MFKTHKEGVKYRMYCHFPVTAEFGRYLAQIILEQGKGWKESGVGNKDRMGKWERLQRNTREKKEGDKDKKM